MRKLTFYITAIKTSKIVNSPYLTLHTKHGKVPLFLAFTSFVLGRKEIEEAFHFPDEFTVDLDKQTLNGEVIIGKKANLTVRLQHDEINGHKFTCWNMVSQ